MSVEPDTGPAGDEATLDVFMQGTTFFDMVLTGLPSQPVPGTEIHAEGMGSCPGGIANLAIAASRLGLRTGLASTFGDDVYGDFLWRTLEQEGVDLARSQRVADWHSPVTVSLAMQRDRAMVTHAHDSPIAIADLVADPPPAKVGFVSLEETAEVLKVSVGTVRRDWTLARAWLHRELSRGRDDS